MIKDENNIAIFTCVIVMIAVGMVLQRADGVSNFFDTERQSINLVNDVVNARVNSLVRVDVLANDEGVSRKGDIELQLVSQPECGYAVARKGAVEFLASADCRGIQKIAYSVKGTSTVATVAAQIVSPARKAEPTPAPEAVAQAGKPPATAQHEDATPLVEFADDAPEPAPVAFAATETENELAPQAASADAVESDPVRDLTGTAPTLSFDGGAADVELATLSVTERTDVNASAIAPLSFDNDPKLVHEVAKGKLLSALGFTAAPETGGDATVMMMVIDRGFPGHIVPTSPEFQLIEEPAVLGDAGGAQRSSETEDGVLLAALPGDRAPNAPQIVGDALSVTPVDPEETPYTGPSVPAAIGAAAPVPATQVKDAPAEETHAEETQQELEITVARLGEEPTADVVGAAAAPVSTAKCIVPPSVSMSPGRAARTTLLIAAPCLAGTVAEVSYSNIDLAVMLDADGNGKITVPGFDTYTPASLYFANGEALDIELQFRDVQRISRIAIAWQAPVALELNALEFGATYGDSAHVRPENPRGYKEIRKTGGGFLMAYSNVGSTGQNLQVYTHLHRQGGDTGVVKMMIDFASRSRDGLVEACGEGAHAAPMFDVFRVDRGSRQRRTRRQIASVACSEVAQSDVRKSLISGAVEDLLVTSP